MNNLDEQSMLRLRRRWHADLAAVQEALNRLGVPPHSKMRWSESRFSEDGEPCPALMERLGWLEGHVAALRVHSLTATPARRPALRICSSCKTVTSAKLGALHDACADTFGTFEDLKP